MPLLTIITITYNAEKFLERTLKSVHGAMVMAKQNDKIEYLIIDGNSKDNTLNIAETYHSIVTTVISEPDQGLYDAMNKGLKLARGKYIWFLNAGDEVYTNTTIRDLFENFGSDADIYYGDAMLVREDGTEAGLRSKFTPHALPENLKWQDFATGMKVCHQAFIVKTIIAPLYDFSNLSADIDWEINCLKKSKNVKFVDFILCRYLLGGTSIKNHKKSLLDRFIVLQRHFGLPATILNHLFIFWRGFWFSRKNGKYW